MKQNFCMLDFSYSIQSQLYMVGPVISFFSQVKHSEILTSKYPDPKAQGRKEGTMVMKLKFIPKKYGQYVQLTKVNLH